MFLRCSYFLANLSLNVLINMVLTRKKECMTLADKHFCSGFFFKTDVVEISRKDEPTRGRTVATKLEMTLDDLLFIMRLS